MQNEIYIRATDAGKMLGYVGDKSLTNMARMGKIPGARQKGAKGIWEVPLSWVQSEMKNNGEPKGPGKPRGQANTKSDE